MCALPLPRCRLFFWLPCLSPLLARYRRTALSPKHWWSVFLIPFFHPFFFSVFGGLNFFFSSWLEGCLTYRSVIRHWQKLFMNSSSSLSGTVANLLRSALLWSGFFFFLLTSAFVFRIFFSLCHSVRVVRPKQFLH